jgi:hypothetical protein
MFMTFDKVRYVGHKLLELRGKIGEVIKRIPTGGYVVDFGDDAYIISDENLARPSIHENTEVFVRRTRKWDTDLDTE